MSKRKPGMVGSWQLLSSREVYRNPWIRVHHEDVIQPDGKPGMYGVVEFVHHAVGCVPLDGDGYTWLVGQHRYPLDVYSWEIPEGGARMQADPLEEVKRELQEETGLKASEWISLGQLHTSNSVCRETATMWLARGLSQGVSHPEGCEDLQVRRLPFAEAVAMALDGRITDSISVVALLRAKDTLQHLQASLDK